MSNQQGTKRAREEEEGGQAARVEELLDAVDASVRIKLRSMLDDGLLQTSDLGERNIEDLQRFDAAVALEILDHYCAGDLSAVRNRRGFLAGAIRKRLHLARPDHQPMDAESRLHPDVRSRLMSVRQVTAGAPSLDSCCVDALASLPPSRALEALDRYAGKDLSQVRNPSALFMSIIRSIKEGGPPPPMPPNGHGPPPPRSSDSSYLPPPHQHQHRGSGPHSGGGSHRGPWGGPGGYGGSSGAAAAAGGGSPPRGSWGPAPVYGGSGSGSAAAHYRDGAQPAPYHGSGTPGYGEGGPPPPAAHHMQHPQQPVVLPVGGAAAAAAAGGGGGYASVLAATAAGAGTLSQGPHGTLVFTPAAAAAAPVATVQPVVLPGGAGTAPGGAAGAPTLLLAAGRGGVQQYTLLSAAPVLAGAPAAAAGSAPLLQLTPQQHGPAIVQQPAPGAALHAVPPGAVLAPAPLAPPGVPPDWAAGRRSYGAEQAQMGVRVSEFHELSPFAPFVHPSSALKLQALWDGGNELVSMLDDEVWRVLAELAAPEALAAIQESADALDDPQASIHNINAFFMHVVGKIMRGRSHPGSALAAGPPGSSGRHDSSSGRGGSSSSSYGRASLRAPGMVGGGSAAGSAAGGWAPGGSCGPAPHGPTGGGGQAGAGGAAAGPFTARGIPAMHLLTPQLAAQARALIQQHAPLLREGHFDEGCCSALMRMAPGEASSVLHELSGNSLVDVRNVAAYIMGVIKRYGQQGAGGAVRPPPAAQ